MLTEQETQSAITSLLKRICETASPTFKEQNRAALIKTLFEENGLSASIDEVGNVIAKVTGGTGPRVLVAAHLDTVFPETTDVSLKELNGKLAAPGVGDNSASLSVLVHSLTNLPERRPQLTIAATVGEEGVGDLYGIRELMRTHNHDFDIVIALDGHLGTIVTQAVGSKRFEVNLEAKGGHSWGDYPSPSSVHALADMIHEITRISVPREPRSSLNIGQIKGGTSINAIAQNAQFNLDLRSLDPNILAQLEREAKQRILKVARQHNVTADVKQIGDRPAGKCKNENLIKAAKIALENVNVLARTAASSTDANIPMSLNIDAISFGVYTGGDAHRLSEWLEPASLAVGAKAYRFLLEELSQLS